MKLFNKTVDVLAMTFPLTGNNNFPFYFLYQLKYKIVENSLIKFLLSANDSKYSRPSFVWVNTDQT